MIQASPILGLQISILNRVVPLLPEGVCGECSSGAFTRPRKRDNTWKIVPKNEILWDKFDKTSGYPTQLFPSKQPVCQQRFHIPTDKVLIDGAPRIPETKECQADTCEAPNRAKCPAKSMCQKQGQSSGFWAKALSTCRQQTMNLLDENGCTCLKNLCSCPAEVSFDTCYLPPDEDPCEVGAVVPDPAFLFEYTLPIGTFEYATMDFSRPTAPPTKKCVQRQFTRPPDGWEVVPEDDDILHEYLTRAASLFTYGGHCLYKRDGTGIGDCDDSDGLEVSDTGKCYKLSSCGDRILIRRPRQEKLDCESKATQTIGFALTQLEVDPAGGIVNTIATNATLSISTVIDFSIFSPPNKFPELNIYNLLQIFGAELTGLKVRHSTRFLLQAVKTKEDDRGYLCGIGVNRGKNTSHLTTHVKPKTPGVVIAWSGASSREYDDQDTYWPMYRGSSLRTTNWYNPSRGVSAAHGWCVGPIDMVEGNSIDFSFSDTSGIDDISIVQDHGKVVMLRDFLSEKEKTELRPNHIVARLTPSCV